MRTSLRTHQVLTFTITSIGFFMVLLDASIVTVALPTIQSHLHASLSDLQWVVDAYTLPFAVLLLTAGTLGDRFGRKRVFLAGLAIFTIGSALCGLAPSLGWLIAGRVLQGAGGAALSPGSLSLLAAAFPDPRQRTQAIGISSGISGVALAAGPLLGGVLIQISGWQAIFFVNLPIGIAVLLSGINLLAESRNPAAHRLDVPGQILAIAGLTALTYALIEGNAQGWGSPLIAGLFATASVLLAVFVVVEARSGEPMLPLEFFKNASFSVANAVALVVGFALLGTVFFISQYFQGVQGFVPLASGLRSLPNTMGIFVAAPIAGTLAARLGPRVPITLGALCSGTALLLLMRLGPTTPYAAIWWNLGLGGIGFGLMLSPLAAAVLGALPPTRSGLASSMINMSRQVGGVFGVALLGALVQGQYASNIANGLTQHGIPGQISQSIANAIAGAGIQAGKVLGKQHLPLPATTLHALANQSFTDALHGAFLVAGIALLVSAIASAFLLGRRQPVAAANPEATAELQPPEAMPAVAEIA